LAEKLEYVYTHPEEVGRIVKRGQQVYLAHKWSSERERFLTVLEGLLNGPNRTALKTEPSGYSTAINPG